jgi:glucosamine-6-phosphate deaminase
MNLVVVEDYAALCRAVAGRIASLARVHPAAVLGLPTGETPLGAYRELARRVRNEELDLSRLTLFALNEYLDVGRGDPRCLADWLHREFVGPCRIDPVRVLAPDGQATEPALACADYEAAIARAGGIDLQLLGLGSNGHVGFNEPLSPPDSRTRVVRLAPESIVSDARYWGGPDKVPHYGVTLGIGTIMEAREILLLVSGVAKAGILKEALEGPLTSAIPASLLRPHPRFTLIADQHAAAYLESLEAEG